MCVKREPWVGSKELFSPVTSVLLERSARAGRACL